MKTVTTTCVNKAGSERQLLSRAEMRTLLYVIAGLTTQEIAEKLGRSPETVKSHRESILRKLGAENISHAIALAYERGILKPGTLSRVQDRLGIAA